MSDFIDEILEERKILKERPSRAGWLIDFLSGIFLTGTIMIGLLFVVIFINPESRFNPLSPVTTPVKVSAYEPTLTLMPALPPTWTPTSLPTDIPTSIPIPTETPGRMIELSPTPTSGLDREYTGDKQLSSPTPASENLQLAAECVWQGGSDGNNDLNGPPVKAQLAPQFSQTEVGINSASPDQLAADTQLVKEGISVLFTPEIQYWEDDILAWGEEYGLDPNLIATVMQIESCGYARAKSAAGAMGLFQVMPQHFKDKENPYDPEVNAFRGLSWLQKTLRHGGSTSLALAGYNAGIARINNPYLEWPAETKRYVEWGESIYQDSICEYESSPALQHWLSKGGSALCDRAAAEQQDQ
jgi:hypothetical protein